MSAERGKGSPMSEPSEGDKAAIECRNCNDWDSPSEY